MVPFKVENWQKTASERRSLLKIPEKWKVRSEGKPLEIPAKELTHRELEITETTAAPLLLKLASGEWSSEEVTLAFCHRAAIAHQLTNCLTWLLVESAVQRARELDQILAKTGPIGPLHGLPISLKEIFNVKDTDTTFGFVSWAGNYKEDGLVASLLRERGAVIFAKTNIAQGCLIVEGLNNLFGKTLNPHNTLLTPAGSSSGEGALLAMKGSPLGVGTDGGGSIRLPAHSNGVYGFMPSTNRVTSLGIAEGKGGLSWVRGQIGPLANDVDSLAIWTAAMIGLSDHDWEIAPIPWTEPMIPESLRIGVIFQDNVVETTPAMLRPLQETCAKLKDLGHEIVELNVGDLHRRITETVFRMYVASGHSAYQQSVRASGEPFVPRCCGSESKRAFSLAEVHELDSQARSQSAEYLKIFVENDLDVILTPSSPTPAAPHGMYSTNSLSAVYNLLGYCAGIIPTGKIDLIRDAPTEAYLNSAPLPDLDVLEDFPYDRYDAYVRDLYRDVSKFANAPTSIQVVGRNYTDEKLLRIMKVIDLALS